MEEIAAGQTDRTIDVFIPDPASTTGQGKTGLAHTDITVKYIRVETDNDVILTDVTGSLSALSALTDAHADWGWKEIGMGHYRLDVADAVFASGAWYAIVHVQITTGTAAATPKAFRIVTYDVEAIGSKTNNLPSDPADDSDIDAQLATIAGYIDTEVAAILAAVDTEVGAIKAVTDKLDTALELDGGVYRYTTNALEQAPGGGGRVSLKRGAGPIPLQFWMRQLAEPKLGATGLMSGSPTITAERSLDDGATWEPMENGATIAEITPAAGAYVIVLDNADLDGDSVIYRFSHPDAVDTVWTFILEQP